MPAQQIGRGKIVQQPQSQIQSVSAQIDQTSATLDCWVEKVPPSGDSHPPDHAGPGKVEGAEGAFPQLAVKGLSGGREPGLVPHCQQDAHLFRCLDHPNGILSGDGHGLFAQHMLSCAQGCQGNFCMAVVRRTDTDGINVFTGQKFRQISTDCGARSTVLLLELLSPATIEGPKRDA